MSVEEKTLANWERRFWPKVEKRGPDECWPWLASKTAKGYGKFGIGGKFWMNAHRAAWIITHRKDPVGLDVDHLCHNPGCVNPAHLEAVTHAENMRRLRCAQSPLCKRGHKYAEKRTSQGQRYCPECEVIRQERKRAKKSVTA